MCRSPSNGSCSARAATAGQSLDTAFNENHIAATTQAIVEYRAAQGITGPLFIGTDTHALSAPAETTALEVLVGQRRARARRRVRRLRADAGALATRSSPTTAARQAASAGRRHRRHPEPQPAARRRLQVQPAARRPGRQRRHQLDRQPRQRAHRRRPARRQAWPSRAPWRPTTSAATTSSDLENIIDMEAIKRQRHPHRRRPARRRERRLLGRHRATGTSSTSPSSTRTSTRPGGS